jgi:hypothetical protein
MKRAFLLRFALGLILLTCLSSCGSEFRKAWNQPTPCTFMLPTSADATTVSQVAGKWEGTWLSEASGHHGELRCVVDCKKGKPGDHEFFYHATWKNFLSGSYKAIHTVQKQKDGTYTFKGEHKMPDWAGGLYHYEGTIRGEEFKANYRCSMDNGTYTMKRVR